MTTYSRSSSEHRTDRKMSKPWRTVSSLDVRREKNKYTPRPLFPRLMHNDELTNQIGSTTMPSCCPQRSAPYKDLRLYRSTQHLPVTSVRPLFPLSRFEISRRRSLRACRCQLAHSHAPCPVISVRQYPIDQVFIQIEWDWKRLRSETTIWVVLAISLCTARGGGR